MTHPANLREIPEPILTSQSLNVFYDQYLALRDISLRIPSNSITALIGPSGCGKTSLIRTFNRLNDLIPGFHHTGAVCLQGYDIYAQEVDPVEVRRRIGMVFQKPNPFPKSVFENVAFGARNNGYKGDLAELVETSLQKAALWDDVKDKLRKNALSLSGGQQQRLCIARALAVKPAVILMDEPCSALDPISTRKIENLMTELKKNITLVVVTHNMQQAARIADYTAFLNVERSPNGEKIGYLVEFNKTELIFHDPEDEATRDYISGRFG
jgi:phosphate transport system ATP-binding protein